MTSKKFKKLEELVDACGPSKAPKRKDFEVVNAELRRVYDGSDEAFQLKSKLGRYEHTANPMWRSGNKGPVDRWTNT